MPCADRAEANDHGGVTALDPRAPHRAEAARQRLDERRRLVAHVPGHAEHRVPDVRPGNADVLRESARVEVRGLEGEAHGLAAAPAVVAGAAGHVVGGDDAVADRTLGDARAERRHLAHHLVAEHDGYPRARVPDLGEVRAAEAAAHEAQEHVALTERGARPVLADEPAALAEDGGLHRLGSGACRHAARAWAGRPNRAATQQRRAIATLRAVGTTMRSSNTRKRRASISSRSAR